MIRDGTRHPLSRFLVGLLAAWMVVTAVLSTVHNHQLPGPASSILALERPEVAASQTGTCFACLAAHVPLPAPMAPAMVRRRDRASANDSRIQGVTRLSRMRCSLAM